MYRLSSRSLLKATAATLLVVTGLYFSGLEIMMESRHGQLADTSKDTINMDSSKLVNIRKESTNLNEEDAVARPRVLFSQTFGEKSNTIKRDNLLLTDPKLDLNAPNVNARSFGNSIEEPKSMDLNKPLAAEEMYSPQFLCGDTIRSGYCVMENFKSGQAYFSSDETVTLTTQGTVDFLSHVPILCSRWQGPISITVYAPGSDFDVAEDVVDYLNNCNACVKLWVTWHLIFDITQPPWRKEIVKRESRNCSVPLNFSKSSCLEARNLTYPINVARNVARINARTDYVFASDIELYPSLNVIPEFLDMIRERKKLNLTSQKEVYVLPVFEVGKTYYPPSTKAELVKLYARRKVISFHRYVCNNCHQIPKLSTWLTLKKAPNSPLSVFLTVRRDRKNGLEVWEPFFIGTNNFPLFDERLSWNGKANKMQVVEEMCYLEFDFHIVDDAFLVHAPGIKVFSAKKELHRRNFARKNNKVLRELKKKWRKQYGRKNAC